MTDRGPRWIWLEHVRTAVRAELLDSRASHVAFALAVHYMNGKGEAWPSQKELAAATGLSVRTIRKGLRDLEQNGLLKHRYGTPASKRGCVYTLLIPALAAAITPSPNGSIAAASAAIAGSVRA